MGCCISLRPLLLKIARLNCAGKTNDQTFDNTTSRKQKTLPLIELLGNFSFNDHLFNTLFNDDPYLNYRRLEFFGESRRGSRAK